MGTITDGHPIRPFDRNFETLKDFHNLRQEIIFRGGIADTKKRAALHYPDLLILLAPPNRQKSHHGLSSADVAKAFWQLAETESPEYSFCCSTTEFSAIGLFG